MPWGIYQTLTWVLMLQGGFMIFFLTFLITLCIGVVVACESISPALHCTKSTP